MPVTITISLLPDSQDPSVLEAVFPSLPSESVGIRLLLLWSKRIPKLQLCLMRLCPEGRACPSIHHQGLYAISSPLSFLSPSCRETSSLFEYGGWEALLSRRDFVYSWSLLYLWKGIYFWTPKQEDSFDFSFISITSLS